MNPDLLTQMSRKTYTPRYTSFDLEGALKQNIWRQRGLLYKHFIHSTSQRWLNFVVHHPIPRIFHLTFTFIVGIISVFKLMIKAQA